MTDYKALLKGYPIYIATKEIQRKKHHKKRINKKWRKRYGMIEINYMPHGEVIILEEDYPVISMTKKTYRELIGRKTPEVCEKIENKFETNR